MIKQAHQSLVVIMSAHTIYSLILRRKHVSSLPPSPFVFFFKDSEQLATTHNFRLSTTLKKTLALSQCVCGEKFSMDEKVS